MKIVMVFVMMLVIGSSVSAVTATTSKTGWTAVKGTINLPSTQKKNTTVVVVGPVAYSSAKGFKGANTGPKGFIDLNLSKSKIDLERQTAAAKKTQAAAPTKYTALIAAMKQANTKGYRKYK